MEGGSLAEDDRCRALLLGPDPPPPRVGPCRAVWVPLHAAIPVSGSYLKAVQVAAEADVAAFTSPRAPRMLALDASSHGDPQSLVVLRGARLAAVGPATARAIASYLGVPASLVAPVHTGWHLGAAIVGLKAGRVAWIRGDPAGRGLRMALEEAGVELVDVTVYKLVPTGRVLEALRLLEEGGVWYVVFTSPSAARALAPRMPPGAARIVAIGPTTAGVLRGFGLAVDCTPRSYDMDGVAECVNRLEKAGATGA